MKNRRLLVICAIAFLINPPADVWAQQGHPVLDAPGVQKNRDYFSELSFENIDTLTGGLVLTFTDLVLPSNAGRQLQFQRTYNSKGGGAGSWYFGIVGIPLRIFSPEIPAVLATPSYQSVTPALHMSDGSVRKMAWYQAPNEVTQTGFDKAISSNFWIFDRAGSTRRLSIPNGDTCDYETESGVMLRVTSCSDPFDNEIDFDWQPEGAEPPRLVITQSVGADSRVITLEFCRAAGPCTAPAAQFGFPASMTYEERVWTYTPTSVSLPVGPGWSFGYGASGVTSVTTPHGGVVEYTYAAQPYEGPDPQTNYQTTVVSTRATSGPGVTAGEWHYVYQIGMNGVSGETTVTLPTPPGTPERQTVYRHGPTVAYDPQSFFDGEAGLVPLSYRAIEQKDGSNWVIVEKEEREYEYQRVLSWGSFGTLELNRRTITRDGGPASTAHTTWFEYREDDATGDFADYHNPSRIREKGTIGAGNTERITERTFEHLSTPYVVALPLTETVEVGSEVFEKSWEYNGSGFKTLETIYGVPTAFTPDSRGNVFTITTATDKTTVLQYKHGQAWRIWTPKYLIQRTINPDGTIADETRAGRTTSFTYDKLARLTATQPAGGTNATVINYNIEDRTVTSTRGTSVTTTHFDGFGRPLRKINPVSVEAKTEYDAEGRVTRETHPFRPSDPSGHVEKWTRTEYDALGRVTTRTNPDGSTSTRTYAANGVVTIQEVVTMVPLQLRSTVQTWQAFGNPDEARLAGLVDANAHAWSYGYNAIGRLVNVTDGTVTRSWAYADQTKKNVVTSETHPESLTTSYGYDAAGVLASKSDANGKTTTYTYDGNDRLEKIVADGRETTITYEIGSDNRLTAINPFAGIMWQYDPLTGRLQNRRDTIGDKAFTTLFEYNGNDDLTAMIYPSGRRIEFTMNPAGQPERIFEAAASRDYATGILYHASGGVRFYTAGNLSTTTIGYDPDRYWTTTLESGPLNLTYGDYDAVGNPRSIADNNRPTYGQTFTYDALDRLVSVAGPASPSYTYDAYGNRTGAAYQYNSRWQLTNYSGTGFTYDDGGNMLTAGSTTFAYTPQNQVELATAPGLSATYAYDSDDHRVKKTVGTSTTYYIRGANGELLTEWKDPGTANGWIRDYIYLGTRLLSAVGRSSPLDPSGFNIPSTVTHRFATSWQAPDGTGGHANLYYGVSAVARKSMHPDMPMSGLRIGMQEPGTIDAFSSGPAFIHVTEYPKQAGVFIEFEVERRPYLHNAEFLGINGGPSNTDTLRLYMTPGGELVLKLDAGWPTPKTLWTSAPIELGTPHTLELRFEFNSKGEPYNAPNPPWEDLTSWVQVIFDGQAAIVHGGGPGAVWNSDDGHTLGSLYGVHAMNRVYFKSPGRENGLLMNIWRTGLAGTPSGTQPLNVYGSSWRTTLLQTAGPGTYSQWTGGQPDWRARSIISSYAGFQGHWPETVQSTGAGQKLSYRMESMLSRGITGTIGNVLVGVRMQYAWGAQVFIRRNGVETILTGAPLGPTQTYWYRVANAGWSPTDVIEVGLISSENMNWLNAVAVLVEHNTPEPQPLTDTSARVMTFPYTGNGTAQTITFGIDQVPTALFVIPVNGPGGVEPIWWWNSRLGAASMTHQGTAFTKVWPQKGKLHVVNTGYKSPNQSGISYLAIALFDPSGRYVIPFAVSKPQADDNYTHFLRYPQSGELANDFTPDFVFGGAAFNGASGDDGHSSVYRGPGHVGDQTGTLATTWAADVDRIQAIGPGTVQFGTKIHHRSGDHAFWAGRVSDGVSPTRLMAVASYVGDGTGPRNIALTLGGSTPVLAFVVPTNGGSKFYRVAGDTSGRDTISGYAYPNTITAMGANQITVGSALNAVGVTYDVWTITTGLVQ
jgi:YD repeat-containing protein